MPTIKTCRRATGAAATVLAVMIAASAAQAQELNIYSSRHYDTDQALYDGFTEATGITVNLIEAAADELIARLVAEGENSPADLLITVDAGRLWRADDAGLFQPVSSEILEARIPEYLRHPDDHWFAFSKRARVIVYNVADGIPEGLDTYEDLADPAYRDMVCIRSSSNIYNQSLLASIVASEGVEAAEAWAEGVVANFARDPQGNDTAQLRAVAAGECPLGIVNTYYIGRLIGSDDADDRAVGEQLGVIFPNQGGRGTHVNVSGAGVLASAPNPDSAIAFLEYLTTEDAQIYFASGNNEYPVVEGVAVPGPIASFGTFDEDSVNANALGANNAEAVRIFDRVGWQ